MLGPFVVHSCLFHNHKPGVCATSCVRFGFSTIAKITLVKHLASVLLQGVRWQIAAHNKDVHNYSPKDYYVRCITSLHSLEREDQSWPLQRDPSRIKWNCTSVLHINPHKPRALHSSVCPFLLPAVPSSIGWAVYIKMEMDFRPWAALPAFPPQKPMMWPQRKRFWRYCWWHGGSVTAREKQEELGMLRQHPGQDIIHWHQWASVWIESAIKLLHFFTVESPGKHIGYGFSLLETWHSMSACQRRKCQGIKQKKTWNNRIFRAAALRQEASIARRQFTQLKSWLCKAGVHAMVCGGGHLEWDLSKPRVQSTVRLWNWLEKVIRQPIFFSGPRARQWLWHRASEANVHPGMDRIAADKLRQAWCLQTEKFCNQFIIIRVAGPVSKMDLDLMHRLWLLAHVSLGRRLQIISFRTSILSIE